MSLNFVEQNVTKYLNISNQQYNSVNKNTVELLKPDNLFVWKLYEAISHLKAQQDSTLWENRTEEFLIKQWIEYANSQILNVNVIQVKSTVLNELNELFEKQEFLVSNRLTLADVFLYYSLISIFKEFSSEEKEALQHVSRWFKSIQSLPKVRRNNPIVEFTI